MKHIKNTMIDEIKLFRSMIKYHATIVGWLIKNEKVEKLDNKLIAFTLKDKKSQYIQTYKGKVYITNGDGSKRIPGSCWDKDFTEIKLRHGSVKGLIAEGFEIFDISNTSDRYCLTSQVGKLLLLHYDILGDISFPEGFPRLKGEEALAYIKWMKSKHEYLMKRDYKFNLSVVSSWGYIGLSGFSEYQPKVIDNIHKFDIFAYKPLYKQIEWTFDLVEKYKDQIIWERLMDDSNLIWEEDMLVKYDKYIPYKKYKNGPDYPYDDNSSQKFEAYEKLGFLSNTFLSEHIDVLDWKKVLEKCKFSWNKDDLIYFCRYVLNHDKKYLSHKTYGIYGRPLYDVEAILKNEHFNWDADKLYAYLQLHDDFWNSIQKYKKLHKIFLQIPNVKEIAKPYIKDENFWDIVSYDHDFDYEELSKEFTIDNIKKNLKNWSTPIENKFIGMHRTPDTNYYYYWVLTKWDEMYTHKNIPLTYELAKFLKSIDITIGGTYCKSDGGYIEEDHRNQVWNGLKFFTDHYIESEKDMIRIINDVELLDSFLKTENTCNEEIVSFMVDYFFNKTCLQEYLDIINQMKDWDSIREFNN